MFAAIMCSNYNAAARGGAGAVMGSKNLKAIAVRGTRPVEVAEPDRFKELVGCSVGALPQAIWRAQHAYLWDFGQRHSCERNAHPADLQLINPVILKTPNKISGQALVDGGYLKRRVGCYSCPMSCHRYSEVKDGKYQGAYAGGPEYETFSALGSGTGVSDIEAIIRANELCDIYGLDTISTGSVIQWAMECHQRELNFDRGWFGSLLGECRDGNFIDRNDHLPPGPGQYACERRQARC